MWTTNPTDSQPGMPIPILLSLIFPYPFLLLCDIPDFSGVFRCFPRPDPWLSACAVSSMVGALGDPGNQPLVIPEFWERGVEIWDPRGEGLLHPRGNPKFLWDCWTGTPGRGGGRILPNPGNPDDPKSWESSGTGRSLWECCLWNSGGKEKAPGSCSAGGWPGLPDFQELGRGKGGKREEQEFDPTGTPPAPPPFSSFFPEFLFLSSSFSSLAGSGVGRAGKGEGWAADPLGWDGNREGQGSGNCSR